ncbi:MAG: hypothetical protein NUV74_12935 [Candidatus Brocadiaceae bacterium]|nr:hypothetical protein [Candidatus Brocadiaceae bacterium]
MNSGWRVARQRRRGVWVQRLEAGITRMNIYPFQICDFGLRNADCVLGMLLDARG